MHPTAELAAASTFADQTGETVHARTYWNLLGAETKDLGNMRTSACQGETSGGVSDL